MSRPFAPKKALVPAGPLRTFQIQDATGQPGHWSDWQPGYTITGNGAYWYNNANGGATANVRSASAEISKSNASAGGTDPFPFATHDLHDLGAEVLSAARNATPAGGSLRGVVKVTGSKLGQLGVRAFAPPDAAFYDWGMTVELSQLWAQWRLPNLALDATQPAPLDGLGVPWGPQPDGSPGWDWEASTPTSVHWADIPIIQYPYSENVGVYLTSADYDAAAYTFSIPVEYFAVPGNNTQAGAWVDVTGAVKIGELNLNFTVTGPFAGPGHMTSTPSTGTLDLSGVDFAEMTIVSQVKAVRSGGSELFADVPEIPQTGEHNWLNSITYDMLPDAYVVGGGELFGAGGPGANSVTYTAQTPRWRYWIPGTNVGHWSDWQPGYSRTIPRTDMGSGSRYIHGQAGFSEAGAITDSAHDLRDLGETAIADARSTISTNGGSSPPPGGGLVDPANKVTGFKYTRINADGSALREWVAQVTLHQYAQQWQANTDTALADVAPAGLTSTDSPPGGGHPWQWESPTTTRTGTLPDVPLHALPHFQDGNPAARDLTGLPGGFFDLDTDTIYDFYGIPRLVSLDFWVNESDAVLLGSTTQHVRDASAAGSVGEYPADVPFMLYLSRLGNPDAFTLIAQPRAAKSGGRELFVDVPEHPVTIGYEGQTDYAVNLEPAIVQSGSINTGAFSQLAADPPFGAVVVQYPRWRYWIPERNSNPERELIDLVLLDRTRAVLVWSDRSNPVAMQGNLLPTRLDFTVVNPSTGTTLAEHHFERPSGALLIGTSGGAIRRHTDKEAVFCYRYMDELGTYNDGGNSFDHGGYIFGRVSAAGLSIATAATDIVSGLNSQGFPNWHIKGTGPTNFYDPRSNRMSVSQWTTYYPVFRMFSRTVDFDRLTITASELVPAGSGVIPQQEPGYYYIDPNTAYYGTLPLLDGQAIGLRYPTDSQGRTTFDPMALIDNTGTEYLRLHCPESGGFGDDAMIYQIDETDDLMMITSAYSNEANQARLYALKLTGNPPTPLGRWLPLGRAYVRGFDPTVTREDRLGDIPYDLENIFPGNYRILMFDRDVIRTPDQLIDHVDIYIGAQDLVTGSTTVAKVPLTSERNFYLGASVLVRDGNPDGYFLLGYDFSAGLTHEYGYQLWRFGGDLTAGQPDGRGVYFR